jgi:hypothetical protein
MIANPDSRELLALVRQAAPRAGRACDCRARQAAREEAEQEKAT